MELSIMSTDLLKTNSSSGRFLEKPDESVTQSLFDQLNHPGKKQKKTRQTFKQC